METPSDQQDQLLGSAAQNDDHAADGQDEGQHHEKEIATSKVSTGAMTDVALESLMQSAVYESVEELPASGKTEDAVLETGLTSATTQPGQPLCTSGIIETSQSHLPDQQHPESIATEQHLCQDDSSSLTDLDLDEAILPSRDLTPEESQDNALVETDRHVAAASSESDAVIQDSQPVYYGRPLQSSSPIYDILPESIAPAEDRTVVDVTSEHLADASGSDLEDQSSSQIIEENPKQAAKVSENDPYSEQKDLILDGREVADYTVSESAPPSVSYNTQVSGFPSLDAEAANPQVACDHPTGEASFAAQPAAEDAEVDVQQAGASVEGSTSNPITTNGTIPPRFHADDLAEVTGSQEQTTSLYTGLHSNFTELDDDPARADVRRKQQDLLDCSNSEIQESIEHIEGKDSKDVEGVSPIPTATTSSIHLEAVSEEEMQVDMEENEPVETLTVHETTAQDWQSDKHFVMDSVNRDETVSARSDGVVDPIAGMNRGGFSRLEILAHETSMPEVGRDLGLGAPVDAVDDQKEECDEILREDNIQPKEAAECLPRETSERRPPSKPALLEYASLNNDGLVLNDDQADDSKVDAQDDALPADSSEISGQERDVPTDQLAEEPVVAPIVEMSSEEASSNASLADPTQSSAITLAEASTASSAHDTPLKSANSAAMGKSVSTPSSTTRPQVASTKGKTYVGGMLASKKAMRPFRSPMLARKDSTASTAGPSRSDSPAQSMTPSKASSTGIVKTTLHRKSLLSNSIDPSGTSASSPVSSHSRARPANGNTPSRLGPAGHVALNKPFKSLFSRQSEAAQPGTDSSDAHIQMVDIEGKTMSPFQLSTSLPKLERRLALLKDAKRHRLAQERGADSADNTDHIRELSAKWLEKGREAAELLWELVKDNMEGQNSNLHGDSGFGNGFDNGKNTLNWGWDNSAESGRGTNARRRQNHNQSWSNINTVELLRENVSMAIDELSEEDKHALLEEEEREGSLPELDPNMIIARTRRKRASTDVPDANKKRARLDESDSHSDDEDHHDESEEGEEKALLCDEEITRQEDTQEEDNDAISGDDLEEQEEEVSSFQDEIENDPSGRGMAKMLISCGIDTKTFGWDATKEEWKLPGGELSED